jgi:hypothetical protein
MSLTQLAPKRAVPEVVEYLEAALVRARAGEVTGVLILTQDAEGLAYSVAGISNRYTVSGWLMYAIFQLQQTK